MELEQIYNDLYNWWNALPEPKVSWEKAFYGGIKDTIEMRLTYPLVEKPSLDLKVARTLKDMFEGFQNYWNVVLANLLVGIILLLVFGVAVLLGLLFLGLYVLLGVLLHHARHLLHVPFLPSRLIPFRFQPQEWMRNKQRRPP